jgi:hypothetical protein
VRKIFILATNCTHNFLCKRYVHITYEKRKKLNEEKERKVKKENRWGPRTWESAGPSLSVGRSTGRSGRPVARLVFGGKEDCVGGMGARAAGGGGEQQPSGMLAGGRGSHTAYAKERWWMDRRSHCNSRWKMCHRRQGGTIAPGQPTEGRWQRERPLWCARGKEAVERGKLQGRRSGSSAINASADAVSCISSYIVVPHWENVELSKHKKSLRP